MSGVEGHGTGIGTTPEGKVLAEIRGLAAEWDRKAIVDRSLGGIRNPISAARERDARDLRQLCTKIYHRLNHQKRRAEARAAA